MILKASLFLLALTLTLTESKFSFEGYSLIKLTPQTEDHLKLIQSWQKNPQFDVWSTIKGINYPVDILLSPEDKKTFAPVFESINLPFNITVKNVQEKIEHEEMSNRIKRSTRGSIVGRFARYSEIQSYLDDVVSQNSDIASSYVAGKTYENRDLRVLVLKTPSSHRSIWLDFGIHAREWISPATGIYMIDKLISEYRSGVKSVVDLLNKYEFHFLPVLNPDGYEYSHTTYRYWRKNRKPNRSSSCIGTDLNRNSGYMWMTGGSSSNPCSDIYAGPSASSELEIKAMQSALKKKLGNWDAYLTFHSYGEWIFTPWGYTMSLPTDYNELYRVADVGVKAIKSVNGEEFEAGSSTHLLSIGSGGSEDWAKGVAGIKYSYCFELRPSQYGTDSHYGFNIPASRIPYAGAEMYAGVKAMLAEISKA